MVKKEDGSKLVKIGPVVIGLKPLMVIVVGVVLALAIVKYGFEFNIGNWSCNSKAAEDQINIDKDWKK